VERDARLLEDVRGDRARRAFTLSILAAFDRARGARRAASRGRPRRPRSFRLKCASRFQSPTPHPSMMGAKTGRPRRAATDTVGGKISGMQSK
jgi:hypothetical protein